MNLYVAVRGIPNREGPVNEARSGIKGWFSTDISVGGGLLEESQRT